MIEPGRTRVRGPLAPLLLLGALLLACGGGSDAGAGLEVVSLTSPAGRNQTVALVVRTLPNAACSVVYTTPAGNVSRAQGLGARNADAAGNVAWSWLIGSATNPCTGRVAVTCAGRTVARKIVIR